MNSFLLEKAHFLSQSFCLHHSNSSSPPPNNYPGSPSHHEVTFTTHLHLLPCLQLRKNRVTTSSGWVWGCHHELKTVAVRLNEFLLLSLHDCPGKRRDPAAAPSCLLLPRKAALRLKMLPAPCKPESLEGSFVILNWNLNFFKTW